MQNSVELHIMDSCPGYFSLSNKAKSDITSACLEYMFRMHTVAKFKKRLASYDLDTTRLRWALLSDGYLMKNLKMWIFHVFKTGAQPRHFANIALDYGVIEEDTKLMRLVPTALRLKLLSWANKYRSLTVNQLDDAIEYTLDEVNSWTRRFIGKKMKFITQSHGITMDDIQADLKCEAMASVLYYYPCIENQLHLTNIVKCKIHNEGINFIKSQALDDKSRFLRDAGSPNGFTNKLVPIDAAVQNPGYADNLSQSWGLSDLSFTVEKLLAQYDGKRRRFLTLLMNYDADFSQYLMRIGATKRPNDVYFEMVGMATYINHALDYLSVDRVKGQKFVEKVKKQLAEYASAAA